ncbi:MAG: amidohydrolase family protein [Anaerolineae bacterium]|nr:amidohydrolase family protein [Anaerolineae bacterium]
MNDLPLSQYHPRPALVTRETSVQSPRFPVIEAHSHLAAPYGGGWDERPLSELLDVLDSVGVRRFVDLDGGWGEAILQRHLDQYKQAAPERFHVFGGVNWSQWASHGDRFGEWAAARLREQKHWGAEGLKIWKPFGLTVRDQHGVLVAIDDPRLVPLWETAAELHLPVTIHIADPVAFFQPLDSFNERWEELSAHPEAHFYGGEFPAFAPLIEAFARLITRHTRTTFIGAHVGCYAENLQWVSVLLDRCPNFYVDIGARLAELGRQPYSARRFFLRYADRILFGTDYPAAVDIYQLHYRFLETDDEDFPYSVDGDSVPPQGRWRIYGLYLPEAVLEKVYWSNAARILLQPPSVDDTYDAGKPGATGGDNTAVDGDAEGIHK